MDGCADTLFVPAGARLVAKLVMQLYRSFADLADRTNVGDERIGYGLAPLIIS